jgi:hypothetical protein
MPFQNVVTWTDILVMCRHGKEGLKKFAQWVHKLYNSFWCLYSTCSDDNSLDEGMHCYAPIIIVCMISKKLEHYTHD